MGVCAFHRSCTAVVSYAAPSTRTAFFQLDRSWSFAYLNGEAERLHRKALAVHKSALGDKHPDTLTSINNLGSLLQDKGDLDGAGALYREALEAKRETLGDRHPSTLASINNLGMLLKAKGDLNGAEALYRESLEAQRETLGDRHPSTLSSISNLGLLLKAKGDLDGAEALLPVSYTHLTLPKKA